MDEKPSLKPGWNKSISAVAIWALSLFILANLILTFVNSGIWKTRGSDLGALAQACDSAVTQYKSVQPAPDVVLMGSSLVMAPIWSADVLTFKSVPDVYHHHVALLLEKELSTSKNVSVGNSVSVINLALPGAMISDGFLLANKLFKDNHKPKILIYGLAPRDFMDDLLTGETRTTVFQRLMTLNDLPKFGGLYFSNLQEKTDFVLNDLFYLYGKRCRYQDKFASLIQKLTGKILGASSSNLNNQALAEKQFLTDTNRSEVWSKSIDEYRKRYNHFNRVQFEKQSQFLNALLEYAHRENIKVILVNMPLSQDNLKLIPNDLYQHYLQNIRQIASNFKCSFVDLQQDPAYLDNEKYYDTVHLNATGGKEFISTLCKVIE